MNVTQLKDNFSNGAKNRAVATILRHRIANGDTHESRQWLITRLGDSYYIYDKQEENYIIAKRNANTYQQYNEQYKNWNWHR